MSGLEVIENKISYIKKHLALARPYQRHALVEFERDPTLRSAVERELYVVAQAAIDLAEAVVAFKHLRKPTTMREAFDILGEASVLPSEFIQKFAGIVGFRNALAHDYEDLDWQIVYQVLQQKLDEVEEFIVYIQKATGTPPR